MKEKKSLLELRLDLLPPAYVSEREGVYHLVIERINSDNRIKWHTFYKSQTGTELFGHIDFSLHLAVYQTMAEIQKEISQDAARLSKLL